MKSAATVTRLQRLVEQDKALLAREIHDDLGGYLIASAMDLTNLRHRFAAHDEDARQKFDRLATMLDGAIDMMRRVTEDLHPTLLDNVGLFAALRWQIKQLGNRSSIARTEHFPVTEPLLGHAVAIALFRAGQEALMFAEDQANVTHVDFSMTLDGDSLSMRVLTDGVAAPLDAGSRGRIALGFLHHRIEALGGDVKMTFPERGGMRLETRVPLPGVLACQ